MSSVFCKIKHLKATELRRDILWTLSGQVIIMLVLLLLNKILSNSLTIEDFGRYNVLKRSTSVLSFVLLGGLGISMPRYLSIAVSKRQYRSIKSLVVGSWIYLTIILLFVSFLYLILYSQLVDLVLGTDNFLFYVICLLYAMTSSANSYIYAYYRGIGQFKSFNICQIISQLLQLVPFIFMLNDLFSIICTWTSLNVLFILCIIIKEYRSYHRIILGFHVSLLFVWRKFKTLVAYSFPRLIGDFFLFAYSAFPVLYIANKLGYDQASYYSVGISLVSMVTPVFSFLGVVLLPSVSKMIANNQMNRANRLVCNIAYVYLCLAIIFILVLYFGMDLVIHLFFADKYLVAKEIGQILVLSLLPQSMYLLFRNPNDAASIFPFNSLILMISFTVLVCGFLFFDSLRLYAYVYLFVAVIQCVLSIIVWFNFVKKYGL